jgi:predicted P-loop ATPase
MDSSTRLDEGGTGLQPCVPDQHKPSVGKVSSGFKASEAKRFLELLGKDSAATWLRAIDPVKTRKRSGGADCQGVVSKADKAWIDAKTADGFNVYAITGNADAIKGTSVKDTDITRCPALFVEWDDGASIEEQMQRWQALELPEPTLMVSTGGKSVHCYWVLLQPLAPLEWKRITARLIAHCNSDKACSNPSRLMRLPGSIYYDKKTGEPTGQCRIIAAAGHRYAAFDIEGCLPAPAPAKAAKAAPSRQWEPRPEADLIDALGKVPAFDHDQGRREELLGLAFRLAAELGADRGLQLMQEHSPDVDDLADYFKAEPDHISAGSIWPFMREHYGIDISRSRTSKTTKRQAAKGTSGQVGGDTAAAGDYSRPVRLETHQVMELLPKRIGQLRLNVRSGEVIAEHRDGPMTLSGNDIGRLYLHLSSPAEKWPKDTTADAVALLAGQSPFDPVADNLNSNTAAPLPMEQWQRLDQHLLGINDPIAAAFLPRYLISAVARVFRPGCYVRQTPVLIGKQERGKSELGRILFGAEHWVEGIGELGKDDLMKAHTAWGVELAELDGVTRRADQERLKAFLTEKTDTYRKPYDRAPEAHHRRFVFWGTSNGAPLRDTTGSTRFVCIPIPDRLLPLDWARQNRSALWSRAVEQYRAGVDWIHTDEPMRAAIAERNSNYQEIDPWAGDIAAYLEQQQRLGQLPVKVTWVLEQLEVTKDRQSNAAAKRVTAIAEQLGWVHGRRRKPYDKNPSTGLWPDAVHTVHTVCTPRGARENANDSNASDESVHTVHTYSPTLSKVVREQEPPQEPAAAPTQTPDTFGAFGVHGVHTAENNCAGVDLSDSAGCTAVCTAGCTEPDWHQKARLLRSADPAMAYATLALMLQTELGVNVTGRQVKEVLEQDSVMA